MARSLSCLLRHWSLIVVMSFLMTTASCGMAQEPPLHPEETPAAESPDAATNTDTSSPALQPEFSKAEAKIAKALDTPTPMEFVQTPLADVVAFLADYHDIAVRLDERALEDAGIPFDLPINFQADKIKLRNALKLSLGKHDLGVHIRHESLFITTVDYLQNEVSTRVYPIYDLLGEDRDGEGDAWVDIIMSTVSPHTWDEQGGPGAIEAYQGRLIVTQTDDVHSQVQSLLSGMRKYHQAAKAAPGKPLPTVIEEDNDGRSIEAWNAILAKELNLEFVDTPLSDVVAFLSERLGVPVKLDERALEDSAIPFDLPINFIQKNVSLRAALAIMLTKHDLIWVIANEVLLITTHDVANEEVFTRIYPVADLVRTSKGTLESWRLIEALQATVMPDSWDDQGGPGAVIPSPHEDVLFITQTMSAHDEVNALLTKLRRTAEKPTAEENAPKPAAKPNHSRHMKVFHLYGYVDTELLAEIVRDLFEPDRWPMPAGNDGDKPVVQGVTGQLVVRHEKKFIDVVEEFVQQAEGRTCVVGPWPTRTHAFALGEHSHLVVKRYDLPLYFPDPVVGRADEGPAEPSKSQTSRRTIQRDGQKYESLVRELVLPDSWGETGPGRVRGMPGQLIVRHTPQGQREVAKLLQKLQGDGGWGGGGNFF